MLTHPEFTARFDAALKGEGVPDGATARDPAETQRRFDVYRNNVAASLGAALAIRFPVIRRLLGEEYFKALGRLYAEAHRPRSPVLHEWGESFAAFLEGFPPLAGYPYLGDVARIEWARGEAFHSADATAADPAIFANADPARLTLRLHDSLRMVHCATPAVSIWLANQPGGPAFDPARSGAEIALIWRDPRYDVPVVAISAGDAEMVAALRSGATLSAAAEAALRADPAHDPQPILIRLVTAGLFLSPEE